MAINRQIQATIAVARAILLLPRFSESVGQDMVGFASRTADSLLAGTFGNWENQLGQNLLPTKPIR